eukprot:GHVP01008834.1.p1 GENE.GHVP01008834.1~~GHVP01008834.1.p1  ORF type:complete len:391 (+),score=52.85 GHVP01008834.1:1049-2221(+)
MDFVQNPICPRFNRDDVNLLFLEENLLRVPTPAEIEEGSAMPKRRHTNIGTSPAPIKAPRVHISSPLPSYGASESSTCSASTPKESIEENYDELLKKVDSAEPPILEKGATQFWIQFKFKSQLICKIEIPPTILDRRQNREGFECKIGKNYFKLNYDCLLRLSQNTQNEKAGHLLGGFLVKLEKQGDGVPGPVFKFNSGKNIIVCENRTSSTQVNEAVEKLLPNEIIFLVQEAYVPTEMANIVRDPESISSCTQPEENNFDQLHLQKRFRLTVGSGIKYEIILCEIERQKQTVPFTFGRNLQNPSVFYRIPSAKVADRRKFEERCRNLARCGSVRADCQGSQDPAPRQSSPRQSLPRQSSPRQYSPRQSSPQQYSQEMAYSELDHMFDDD